MSQRSKVLSIFKQLHRTRQLVFEGDERALTAGRQKINEDFKTNKGLTEAEEINKCVNTAVEAETILRTEIIQGKPSPEAEDTFVLNIHKDIRKFDNIPYQEMPDPPKRARRRKRDEKTEP
ncbi:complex III assembly factor LYRM7-like [Lineus longissimus]|uniref:complex III assembly factor LYRM7-like n=1 Tax=Lineus longissimus TaxID=88925 RepID=UPI002B4F0BF6